MAQISDITVKKADGTTDVVYVAATPSAGDKSPAVWTQNAFSGIQGFRPRFEVQTQDNGAGNVRQMRPSTATRVFIRIAPLVCLS